MKEALSIKRSRSNDGHRSSAMRVLPAIENAALHASCVEEFHRRAARIFHGPKPAPGSPAPKLSDDQVLELRKLRLWHGMSIGAIAAAVGLPFNSIASVCEFRNRVHLDPGPRPAPVMQERGA